MTSPSPAWAAWRERALSVPLDGIAYRLNPNLKRVGSDLIGPCPAGCAHADGFVVTPGKGIFLCRPSGESGNGIDMVIHCLGVSYVEALEFVTGERRPDSSHDESEWEKAARERAHAERLAEQDARAEGDRKAREAKRRADEEFYLRVLNAGSPIEGTQAEAYLRARLGAAPARRLTADLKFVPAVDYWGYASVDDHTVSHLATLPAMVAVVRDGFGNIIAIHQTFLDRDGAPRKTTAPGDRSRNGVKKFRGSPKGGMIRLGRLTDKLAIGEGIESTLGWHSLGFGPEDVSIAAAGSLGALCGKSTGSTEHRERKGPEGKPVWIPNGQPQLDEPGVVLPEDVREIIIIGDGDSEWHATRMRLVTAVRRWQIEKRTVSVHPCVNGADWADVAKARAAAA